MTDGEGKFVLEGLDASLLFEVLAVGKGHTPRYSDDYLDPRAEPAALALEPRNLAEQPPERVLRGKVVDVHGDPLRNATLAPVGKKLGEQGVMFGAIGADPLTVTDEQGRFELSVGEPGMVVLLQAGARAHAARMSPWLTAGAQDNLVTLLRGATVTGVAERDGKPLAGIEMALTQLDRDSGRWLGEYTVGTDAAGRFTFVSVPPDDLYALFGKDQSCAAAGGAIPVRKVQVGTDESTLDVGVVRLEPGARLSGRVATFDGSALPSGTQLRLVREDVQNALFATVAADGSFVFPCVPRELLTLDPVLRTYRVSPENASYDFVNHSGLIGLLQDDTELELVLDPALGEEDSSLPDPSSWKRYEKLMQSPLRGRVAPAAAGKH